MRRGGGENGGGDAAAAAAAAAARNPGISRASQLCRTVAAALIALMHQNFRYNDTNRRSSWLDLFRQASDSTCALELSLDRV